MDKELQDDEIREQLAAYAHKAWARMKRNMLSKCDATLPGILSAVPDAALIIPPDLVARWYRQMNTPYSELPENEKESDRAEADRILTIIGTSLPSTDAPDIPNSIANQLHRFAVQDGRSFREIAEEIIKERRELWKELAKPTVRELHHQAMAIVHEAMIARDVGNTDEADQLTLRAFDLELSAARMIPDNKQSEPTRSILYTSAASLAYQSKQYDKAIELIAIGLSGSPSPRIKTALSSLLDQCQRENKN